MNGNKLSMQRKNDPHSRNTNSFRGRTSHYQGVVDNLNISASQKTESMVRSESVQSLSHEVRSIKKINMGFKRLQNLCEESAVDIVTILMNPRNGFSELLSSTLRPDLLILVMKVLGKAINCEFDANRRALLAMVCNSSSKLLDSIVNYLSGMPADEDKRRNENAGNFILDLLNFYEVVMKKLPNTASEKLKQIFIATDMAMVGIEKYKNVELKEQRDMFDILFKHLKIMIEERDMTPQKTDSRKECLQHMRPPDNFREKSLFPEKEDLLGEQKAFVRPNVIEGSFCDVEDYLDIQFRLLREDFIAPLREGIANFLSVDQKTKRRIDNIRIYRDVLFGDPKVIKDDVGITVTFDPKKKMNIKWEFSKRLMFGSLILFTNDNFNNILIGTVLDRSSELLKEGKIIVHMEKKNEEVNLYGQSFLMIESEAFFEPYKQVMSALQMLNEENFPMEEYIISVENNPRPPNYLLLNLESTYDVDDCSFEPLNDLSWPSNSDLHLDESQYAAFKAALTEEFVVIQGPPGTGKTFLGLKIAKVLLTNEEVWNTNRTPILVVCFTNHALDQFLEGLVPVTDRLVRVGGQSKSNILEKYNLKEKRKHFKFQGNYMSLKTTHFHRMSDLMKSIKCILAHLEELERHRGVVSPSVLIEYGILPAVHLEFFTNYGDVGIMDWLWEDLSKIPITPVNGAARAKCEEGGAVEDFTMEDKPRVLDTIDFDNEDFSFLDMSVSLKFAVDIPNLEDKNATLLKILTLFENGFTSPKCTNSADFKKLQHKYQLRSHDIDYWMHCLRMDFSAPWQEIKRLERIRNIWQLSHKERWTLYTHWVNGLKIALRNKCKELEGQYMHVARLHKEAQQMCDLQVLQNALVVAMTTTNAARLHSTLQTLNPKIVIVEEAAEVLESHIVVSIARDTEHVILIGDHQQLKPSPAVYRLARHFHMDVSLFERMVKNGLACHCLDTQHRMRPEIAALVAPTIYPHLKNHASVQILPAVRGVSQPLFFVTHEAPEEQVEEISSPRNVHEADFVLSLCRHLLLQGYTPEDITILTTYKGQLFYMIVKQRHSAFLNGVKISVVDNYQGEENKIILLSLVRSNEENKIGFLKEDNRVCVALSRAKEGLFIIGNMEVLCSSSTIWPQVKATLEAQGAVGSHLALRCQVHPDEVTHVASAEDFTKVPEGGCLRPCAAIMPCGHRCESVCHVNDREHKQFKCLERCQRIPPECSLEHPCPKGCWEKCGKCKSEVHRTLPCGHEKILHCYIDIHTYKCQEKVQVELPSCKHLVEKLCHEDISSVPCHKPCPDRLPCGHTCVRNCHADRDPDHLEYQCMKQCPRKNAGCSEHECVKFCYEECGECTVEVDKKLPTCGHVIKAKCSVNALSIQCKKDCKRTLECGHWCRRKCFEECGGCQVKVHKKIPSCGHELLTICCEPPNPEKCLKPCERSLPCGHRCLNTCAQRCTEKCSEKVKCRIKILCGHSIEIPCYLQHSGSVEQRLLLSFCEEPCKQELQCGHMCTGTCGKCLQGRLHVSCAQKCERSLICTHKCRVACASACPPCNAPCANRCRHSRCAKPCGVPCDPCMERCGRRCPHGACSRRCSELCDILPCEQPCGRLLRCKHPCVGFCGDRCPPLCRVCNAEELTEIFFGREDEEDARFVYLVDCKHTLEAEGLENWLKMSDGEISLKTCPRCKTYIQSTERYSDYVKKAFKDVAQVKTMVFGELNRLNYERHELLNHLKKQEGNPYVLQYSGVFPRLLKKCRAALETTRSSQKGRRRNFLSAVAIQSLKSEVEIISDLVSSVARCVATGGGTLPPDAKTKIFAQLDFLLGQVEERHQRLSRQETSDLNAECKRFWCVASLAVAESAGDFSRLLASDAAFATLHAKARALVDAPRAWASGEEAQASAAATEVARAAGSALGERERREIVQAMGVKRGAWYKCPNGHVYCISDCGGPMQESRCPECKELIGGTQHRMLRSNRLAPEMDGAVEPAFPQGEGFQLR